jgi:hypothetical protein
LLVKLLSAAFAEDEASREEEKACDRQGNNDPIQSPIMIVVQVVASGWCRVSARNMSVTRLCHAVERAVFSNRGNLSWRISTCFSRHLLSHWRHVRDIKWTFFRRSVDGSTRLLSNGLA